MKKNLRIVSAAAALLAVAPVAAVAMPVNAATAATTASATTTNEPTVDLSNTGSVSESKDTLNVTPSFTLTRGPKSNSTKLQGTLEASLNGTSVTADVADVAKGVTLTAQNAAKTTLYSYDTSTNQVVNNLSDVHVGGVYTMTLRGVGFSFGKANAGKTLTLKVPNNVTVSGANYNSQDHTVTLDQYGNVTDLTFTLDVKAYNSEDTSAVSFYDKKSGLVASQGSYMKLADENGDLNVNTLLDKLKGKYEAMQFENGSFVPVTVTTTVDDVKAELEKAGIKVDAAGNFEAPDTFTVTLNAKSDFNGKTASLPVVVTVPNGKSTVEPSVSKTVMHAAYYYDKNGKRVGTDVVPTYSSVNLVSDSSASNGLKTYTINGKSYYKVANEDKYLAAGNVTGTSRTLKHNAYVYKTSKKRANKVTLKKGSSVTTYGSPVKLANGKLYYRVGQAKYVKVANF
ncbi:SLAP domain-containing protein [Lactobacillus amylolyticus]|uniref:SLAP domain-containing protein n=1 Tax=Lactobacillus amylolyticus TaxID=83683 RepID=UPI000FC9AA5C|nr:SLAP domain-containing protein [Lactobacillus amylolyticus]